MNSSHITQASQLDSELISAQARAEMLGNLERVFGFSGFRPGQQAICEQLLAGNSALAVFPTGGGKSLCYQLPALLLPDVTLVISPLIALMKDQIDFLRSKGVPAARLDSSLDAHELKTVWDDLRNGRLKLLYVAPERFGSERFLQQLSRLRISMMVVDEAHCISEWGHNFRPDYLKLARFARELKLHPVLALTATATPEVARDICRSFDIDPQAYVNTGFHRPNLLMRARVCSPVEREQELLARLKPSQGKPGATVIYVTLQRQAEDLARLLQAEGIAAEAYHAGLSSELRNQIQDRFMASPEAVVVATIAFGMGVDKADIRQVFHYNPPKSLENYAQEIGRAGRDGKPSTVELFACPEDTLTLENFVYGDTPEAQAVEAFVTDLLSLADAEGRLELSVYELSNRYDIRQSVIKTLLCYLELGNMLAYTGPFYDQCKIQLKRPLAEILSRFDAGRQAFLHQVFAAMKQGRLWQTLELTATAQALDEPRERIMKAINYLEELGELELQVSGLKLAYRLVSQPESASALARELLARFVASEQRDIGRIHQVLGLASSPNCLVKALLAYFGEQLASDCGHCDRCLGQWQGNRTKPESETPLSQAERRLIEELAAEGHSALGSARQLARFLCGLASPATQQGRPSLSKDKRFGALGNHPFDRVLAAVASR